jgi:bla regulator protein blaR1
MNNVTTLRHAVRAAVSWLHVEPPLLCAAGITGAGLKKRIREIMISRGSIPVSLLRKLTLAAAGIAAAIIPPAIGIIRAQTLPPPPAYTYDVVSIHRPSPDQRRGGIGGGAHGGLRMQNVTAMFMLTFAYGIHDYQIAGAPGWVSSDRFDVSFTPDKAEPALRPGAGATVNEMDSNMSRQKQRTQAVLRDRFGLILRAETRELPIYALILAKGGHKLSQPTVTDHGASLLGGGTRLIADGPGATMKMLAEHLAGELGRPVNDETGLDGLFNFKLEWTRDSPPQPPSPDEPVSATGGPSIFTALTEQLGLRLESRRGPVPIYVIEKIEKPGEN